MTTAQPASASGENRTPPVGATRASRVTWALCALVATQLVLVPAVALGFASDARQVLVLALTAIIGVAGVLFGSRPAHEERAPALAPSGRRRRELPARLPGSPADADHLTGLLSREGLIAEGAAGRLIDSAIIVLDVARMRAANAAYGHAQGDRLLRALAGRLVATLRPDDLVARWGGDEFVICLPTASLYEARAVLARIEHGLAAHPIALPGGESLGVHSGLSAIGETGGGALATAVREAEEEIHNAKQAGPARRRA